MPLRDFQARASSHRQLVVRGGDRFLQIGLNVIKSKYEALRGVGVLSQALKPQALGASYISRAADPAVLDKIAAVKGIKYYS